MNEIDFRIPLTGSMLFDFHQKAIAHELMLKFPELICDDSYMGNTIRIYGILDDERYRLWKEILDSPFKV